jgi:peptidoglycan/xylan/chitin deacetylase (PgdA/CDA1 family)
VILSYHRVGVEGVPVYSTLEPRIFEAQMRYLRRHYRVLSLADLLCEIDRPTSTVPAVVVTFDDGYRDLFEYAFPVLRKYEIPATVFAIAHAIETGWAPWYDRLFLALWVHPARSLTVELDLPTVFHLENPAARLAATEHIVRWLRTRPDSFRREFCADLANRLPVPEQCLQGRMLTWEQLRIMQDHGVVCGSHTLTHPVLSQVDREERLRELRDSRILLERQLGRPVTDFAFPFGQPADIAGTADAELASSGFRSAVTTISGTNRCGANPYALRRVSIGEQPHFGLFAYWLNSLFLHTKNQESGSTTPELSRFPSVTAVARREGR